MCVIINYVLKSVITPLRDNRRNKALQKAYYREKGVISICDCGGSGSFSRFIIRRRVVWIELLQVSYIVYSPLAISIWLSEN